MLCINPPRGTCEDHKFARAYGFLIALIKIKFEQ
jgi:hypothetical protein